MSGLTGCLLNLSMPASIVENTCSGRDHSHPTCSTYEDVQLALLPLWIQVRDVAVQLRLPATGALVRHVAAAHQIGTTQHIQLQEADKSEPSRHHRVTTFVFASKERVSAVVCKYDFS